MIELSRFRDITMDRVVRSLRFRAMHKLARLEPVRDLSRRGVREADATSPLFPDIDVADRVADLNREGISRGFRLPAETLAEIRAWADASPCFGNHNKEWGFYAKDAGARALAEAHVKKRFTVGAFFNGIDCPAIERLSRDPVLLEIARRYVGPSAVFVSTHTWWSFANEVDKADRNEFAQMFHFDLDDYRFMKVFFYLTDVDAAAGPHVYVRGSHRGKKLRHLYPMRRFTDAEVEETYGKDRLLHVEGDAGSGFAADTFGIHKGLPPKTKDRLIFELEFAQHPWASQNDVVDPGCLKLLSL